MIPFDLSNFIGLLLIRNVARFRDSYSLTRVLERKFKIIETKFIMDNLEQEDLIKATLEKGIHYFEITSKGLQYVEFYMKEGKEMLFENYKEEQDFITYVSDNISER